MNQTPGIEMAVVPRREIDQLRLQNGQLGERANQLYALVVAMAQQYGAPVMRGEKCVGRELALNEDNFRDVKEHTIVTTVDLANRCLRLGVFLEEKPPSIIVPRSAGDGEDREILC